MKIYKVHKRIYVVELDGFLEEETIIQSYDSRAKVIVSDVNNLVPIIGSVTYLDDDSLWFYNLDDKESFLSLENTINESLPVATPMTQADRDLLTLDIDDKFNIQIFNTDLSRKESWDGYHWLGDGDVICKAIPNAIVGMMTMVFGFNMETVRDRPVPVATYRERVTGHFIKHQMGVINHVSSDGLTMTIITNGLCYLQARGPIQIGGAIMLEGGGENAFFRDNIFTPLVCGILLEDHPNNVRELKLARLHSFAVKQS